MHSHRSAIAMRSGRALLARGPASMATRGRGVRKGRAVFEPSADAAPPSRVRRAHVGVKRDDGDACEDKAGSPAVKVEVKHEPDERETPMLLKKTGSIINLDKQALVQHSATSMYASHDGPPMWQHVWDGICHMRGRQSAPVDEMGCASLHDPTADERVQRYQVLISLMLSSQTKDEMTAKAMGALRRFGLTPEHINKASLEDVHACITCVGFHNRKAKYIKDATAILVDQYGGDIPNTLKGLVSLPGVGPKMANLALPAAWGITSGIGVDVHVHRISNRLGWVDTSKPEATQQALEAWLPRPLWQPVNYLLVGFGQTVCKPRGPECGACAVAPMCPSAPTSVKKAARKGKAPVKRESASTATKRKR